MSYILNLKQLKDGSGRVCVHWLIPDESGLIETHGSIGVSGGGTGFKAGPFLDKNVVKKWRVACNPKQNSINPQVAPSGERFMCIPTDEIRAVTCPACLATEEAVAAMTPYVLEGASQVA